MAQSLMESKSPSEIEALALQQLQIPEFRPEYFEIVDGITLQAIKDFDESDYVVACTAVWAGEIRLIDNIILKNQIRVG